MLIQNRATSLVVRGQGSLRQRNARAGHGSMQVQVQVHVQVQMGLKKIRGVLANP